MDVSGSISPHDLGAFLGELTGILQDGDVAVRLINWDVVVTSDQFLDDPDALRMASGEDQLEIVGGGGTDPRCVIELLEGPEASRHALPSFGILLTDGYVSWPRADEWPIDVLVVTTQEPPPIELGYDWVKIETKTGTS